MSYLVLLYFILRYNNAFNGHHIPGTTEVFLFYLTIAQHTTHTNRMMSVTTLVAPTATPI